jgi:hypothetical protein
LAVIVIHRCDNCGDSSEEQVFLTHVPSTEYQLCQACLIEAAKAAITDGGFMRVIHQVRTTTPTS